MPERITQSAVIRVPLKAYLASDHISPATGKTIAITISKNGGAYANPSAGATNATEIASGSYYVDLSTTDTGTLGPLFILGTAGSTDPVEAIYDVVVAGGADLTVTAIATAVWQTNTAGDFNVSQSIGKCLYTGVVPGGAGGHFIAGTNAATTASITGDITGNLSGTVGSIASSVTLDKTQTLSAARNISSVADTSLTINDALHCAIAGAAGRETVVSTTYTVKTPFTGTTLRIFTLDSATAPTSRT